MGIKDEWVKGKLLYLVYEVRGGFMKWVGVVLKRGLFFGY